MLGWLTQDYTVSKWLNRMKDQLVSNCKADSHFTPPFLLYKEYIHIFSFKQLLKLHRGKCIELQQCCQ